MASVDLRHVDEDSPHYQAHAVCANDPAIKPEDFFFEGRFQRNSREQKAHVAYLRSVCARCPVLEECRSEADRLGIKDGFFAGETASERNRRRFPRRGRQLVVAQDDVGATA